VTLQHRHEETRYLGPPARPAPAGIHGKNKIPGGPHRFTAPLGDSAPPVSPTRATLDLEEWLRKGSQEEKRYIKISHLIDGLDLLADVYDRSFRPSMQLTDPLPAKREFSRGARGRLYAGP
jgi:hypothetical protein